MFEAKTSYVNHIFGDAFICCIDLCHISLLTTIWEIGKGAIEREGIDISSSGFPVGREDVFHPNFLRSE